ncbi:MAG TPA: hypothetical protein VFD82_16500 [Planctomycetota bacterium]|nr:hypothetical protein [Planctomycetota bacterium]
MKTQPHPPSELMLAALLLIASSTGVVWLRHEATAVNATTEARRQELDCLVGLEGMVGRAVPARFPDIGAFGGHFAGHELVWTVAPTGAYLTIRLQR